MVVTATAHGAPQGWRTKIYGVSGMKEINDTTNYSIATDITANTLTFNSVNALAYTTYTTGGTLEYNQPVPLAGYSARIQIRSKLASTDIIDELTVANGRIILDTTASTITLTIPASVTAAYTFKTAVYSLELVNGAEVIPFIYGNITLDFEVTR
jgi:molybdopterin-binding protein